MMPYFYAARHNNYAWYGLYYLRLIERLPKKVYEEFKRRHHVMRYNARLLNGIWFDIQTAFMRCGRVPGDIVGIILKPSTLGRWALCTHFQKIDPRCLSNERWRPNEGRNHSTSHKV